MTQPLGLDDRDYFKAFVSFVWRAHPLARVGRGGAFAWGDKSQKYRLNAYADERQLPFLTVGSLGLDQPPPLGQFRFVHQCFGMVGELTAILAILAAAGLSFPDIVPSEPGARPPAQMRQSIVPNAPAPRPNQNNVPNATVPSRRPSESFPSFDRVPQTDSQPARPSEKIPNKAAEPDGANPRGNPDPKVDTSPVKKK